MGAVLLAIVLLIVTVPMAVAWFVLDPERLTPLAREQIKRLAGAGLTADLQQATLALDGPGLVSARLDGLTFAEQSTGRLVLSGGEVQFALSPLALVSGGDPVSAMSLSGATIDVSAMPHQDSALRLTGPDGLLDTQALRFLLLSSVDALSVRAAQLRGVTISLRQISLRMDGAHSIMIEDVALEPETGGHSLSGRIGFNGTSVVLSGRHVTGTDGATPALQLSLDGLTHARSFANDSRTGEPRACEGTGHLALAVTGTAVAYDAVITSASCMLGGLGRYAIGAALSGSLLESGIVEIASGRIDVNRSHFQFDGAVAPARLTAPDAASEPRYRFNMVVSEASLDPADNAEGPMRLTGKIDGSFDVAERRLALESIVTDTGAGLVDGAISVIFGDVAPALYVAVVSDEISVSNFKRLWPRFAAPLPRGWVVSNLHGGVARDVRLEVKIPPGQLGSGTPMDADELYGQADLLGVRFDTIGDIPPIRNADATVRFTGKTVAVNVSRGDVFLPSNRRAVLNGTAFTIDDLALRPVQAALQLDVEGDADAIAELAAARPVNALEGQQLTPASFSGTARATGVVRFPIARPSGQPIRPDYDISVELDDFSISAPVEGLVIQNTAGKVRAVPERFVVDLEGRFAGVPARLKLTEPRGGNGQRTQEFSATLDDALREKFAPALAEAVRGPVPVVVKGEAGAFILDADLTRARIRIPGINWEKGSGIASRVSMRVLREGTTLRLRDIALTGRSLRARGAVRIENGQFIAADLDNVRLNEGDDFSVSIDRQGNGYAVALSGNRIDARAMLRRMLPGPDAAAGGGGLARGMSINGRVGALVGFNDEVLRGAALSMEGASLALSGEFESGGSLRLSRVGGNGGTLALSTGNAGAALRFADLYRRMGGGAMTAEFVMGEGGRMSGPVAIRDFTVAGEPRLAALVTGRAEGSASLSEATEADIDLRRVAFELAQGDLRVSRGRIDIREGVIRGETIGASVEGTVIDGEGRMNLSGTFMPARGLNRIAGSIPILGMLLGSGTRDGLIGITYQIVGEARNPKVFVNPLSIITPGIFRQIFE